MTKNALIAPTSSARAPTDPALDSFLAQVPAIVADTHPNAAEKFLEFFFASIRNPNTRAAYANAVRDFLESAFAASAVTLNDIRPLHVAGYIEDAQNRFEPATVKLRLAALRNLFNWLTAAGVTEGNPAASVSGPRHAPLVGATPILTPEDAGALLASISRTTDLGRRDRALIGLMIYTFARVSAAVGMNTEDFLVIGKRRVVQLKEKGGKVHEMPINDALFALLADYVNAAQLRDTPKLPLFRSWRGGRLTTKRFSRKDAYAMIRKRAAAVGISAKIGNHSMRGTGITTFLEATKALDEAQRMAAHASPRTTQLYDRRANAIEKDAVEKIRLG